MLGIVRGDCCEQRKGSQISVGSALKIDKPTRLLDYFRMRGMAFKYGRWRFRFTLLSMCLTTGLFGDALEDHTARAGAACSGATMR